MFNFYEKNKNHTRLRWSHQEPFCKNEVQESVSKTLTTACKHFNIVSTLSFGWYDVTAWGNVKSTLEQRCVFQRWNLQRRTTLNQCCVFQRWYKQRRNNVVIFNVDMSNNGKRRNNIVLWKWPFLKRTKQIISNRILGIRSFNYYFIIFFTLLPMLSWICRRVLARPRKFFKYYERFCIAII